MTTCLAYAYEFTWEIRKVYSYFALKGQNCVLSPDVLFFSNCSFARTRNRKLLFV